jgi:hypothetical protein
MDIKIFTDRYRFLQKVIFGCWLAVNSDNKGTTLKVLYEKKTKEVTNPLKANKWKVKINNETITDEEKTTNVFNSFFVNKIQNIKESIDNRLIEDPLTKLKEKMKSK